MPEAITTMRVAWMEFVGMGMLVDALLTGIDLAEALIVAGLPEQVALVCGDAAIQLEKAGVHSRAVLAVALLREAAALGEASREMVRETRGTVKRVLREQRALAG